ncbi:MAG: hypothetical protein ACRDCE_08860 [Cetobacterium sp.]|uniref:hypothetical protein n=1 Tax=Cetobacterium sp. TaxID=2071632 RepID=UPI003EE5E4DA
MKRGDTFETTRSGTVMVVDYHNSRRVYVVFPATGYTTTATAQQVRLGNVLDRTVLLNKHQAVLEEKNKMRYSITLKDGITVEGRTYKELSEKTNLSISTIKDVAIGRTNSKTILSFTRY